MQMKLKYKQKKENKKEKKKKENKKYQSIAMKILKNCEEFSGVSAA